MTFILGLIDGEGVYGTFLTYGLTAAFAGGAVLAFIYFWWQGRLDMDEAPKWQMMQAEEGENHHDGK